MTVAYTKLPGLDPEKILAVVDPVLVAHRVEGVELLWVGDRGGQVLRLTIERPDSTHPGMGITVDLCAEISRDLSAALDVADVIHKAYHLEVGSPGVERPLHLLSDYRRFAGKVAKIKMSRGLPGPGFSGQRTLKGTLFGIEEGEPELVLLETETGTVKLPLADIESARLVFSWETPSKKKAGGKRPAAWKSAPPKQKAEKKKSASKKSAGREQRPDASAPEAAESAADERDQRSK